MSIVDQVNSSPICPSCGSAMASRNSARGSFWGCTQFPRCKGTRQSDFNPAESKKMDYEPIVKMPGSSEQEAIWKSMMKDSSHVVVNAGPGSGKTFSMIQGCLRLPKTTKVLFLAFNKHIAREANGKLKASGCFNVEASTYHSLGNSILKKHFKILPKDPNESKMTEIFEYLSPEPLYNKSQWRKTLNLAEKLAALCKNYWIDYTRQDFKEEMERLADHHALDFFNSTGTGEFSTSTNNTVLSGNLNEAIRLVPKALIECKKRASVCIDYDDMVWLPVVLDLPFPDYDMVITDETQDLNALQHEMTLRVGESGRIVIVGDRHQAIYGFRGASTESMETLTKILSNTTKGVKEFPLTITRRCPKLHVQMARYLYSDIQALDDAPLGEILTIKPETAADSMKVGDLVLCRVNQELISVAYALIKRGIRPAIKGRDLGKGLLSFLDQLEKNCLKETNDSLVSMSMIKAQLDAYRFDQETKLLPLGDKATGRLESLHEKCECMMEFISNSKSVEEMRQQINHIFPKDEETPKNCVVLGTVHRTKGLEAERVFVLAPDLIPHPAAKKSWERIQEKNLAWVAATRAKFNNSTGAQGSIIFCGNIPKIYEGGRF